MRVIKKSLLYIGTKTEINLISRFDSEIDYSRISFEWVHELTTAQPLRIIRNIETTGNGLTKEINEVVRLDFFINDILLSDEFLVVPGLSEEAIIGALTMQKWRIKLNFDKDCVEVDPRVAKLQLV